MEETKEGLAQLKRKNGRVFTLEELFE